MNKLMIFLMFTLLLATWEAASRLLPNMAFVLPPPSHILLQVWERSDRFLLHTSHTLTVMLSGFFFAIIAAFPLAWIMSLRNSARILLQPIFIVTQCIPMFTLAPMMVFWFGWSFTAIVVPTALMIFFPLTMNIYQGLCSTPKDLQDYFRINNATAWQTLVKLQLPWAMPQLFAGFRISAAIAGIGAIAGEWAGAQSGLGLLMLESRRVADLEMMFGALFCLLLVSLTLYGVIAFVESQIIRRKFVYLARQSTLGILAFMLLGCQPAENSKTRLLLDWLPNPNHVPLYVGIKKGFFAEQGIDLQVLLLHDVGGLAYLTSGQADLALYYMPATIRAINHGVKVTPIAVLIDQPLNAFIYRTDKGINSPGDLNGKIIGYCADGYDLSTMEHILEANGIVPKQRLNVSFDLVSTLGLGHVDAVYGAFWNIECLQLRALGIETDHFALTDLGVPDHSELIIVAKENSKEAGEEFAEKFQKGLMASIAFCRNYPSEAFEIYLEANPDKGVATQKWEREAWRDTLPLLSESVEIDKAKWINFSNWLSSIE